MKNRAEQKQSSDNQLCDNVLALFGRDIRKRNGFAQLAPYAKSNTLVPLDPLAIGQLDKVGLRYTFVDDLIGPGVVAREREHAAQLEKTWFDAGRDLFTVDNICWPDFDRHAMHWFWNTFTLAIALAEVIKNRKANLKFYHRSEANPGLFYYPSDVCQFIWQALLGKRAKALVEPRSNPIFLLKNRDGWRHIASPFFKLARKSARIFKKYISKSDVTTSTDIHNKIVFAINPGEIHRFEPIVLKLKSGFPHDVAIVALTSSQNIIDAVSSTVRLPTIGIPLHCPETEDDILYRFHQGTKTAIASIDNHQWREAMNALGEHFFYYERRRWPELIAQYRFFTNLWNNVRPKAVITSGLYDSESQIPAAAAKLIGIPTVSIPHGGMFQGEDLIASDYILYQNPIQRNIYLRSEVNENRLIPCKDLVAKNEYPVQPIKITKQRELNILALLNPVSADGCFSQDIRHGIQVNTIKTICSPPSDISQEIQVLFKTHPHWPCMEIVSAAGKACAANLLPAHTDFLSILGDIDLVVALNYSGTALIHVLELKKPVILFWTDAEAEIWTFGPEFLKAGPVARTKEEFWGLIRRFLNSEEFRRQLREQAGMFTRQWLDDSEHPSLEEILNPFSKDDPFPLNQ
jgi:hypothetical protein